ncbi:MAG: ribonuclease G, partial [Gammaproteobacteria bacterium]|nr:ribonuclease G [Gammaproteobacteria bacterium]NNM19901.1 ribonuclease G [Gammaproteobacteria bacterium]
MREELLINVTPREVRAALLENGVLQEIFIDREARRGIVGNVYQGRVSRVLPGMQAAFIDIGRERTAFLHASDIARRVADEDSPEPSEPPNISALVREGGQIIVQVLKDPLGTKGARLTTHITLPSRYMVLMPKGSGVGVSTRIDDDVERTRLRELTERFAVDGNGGGYIVRTAAEGVGAEALRGDMLYLQKLWEVVREKAVTARPGELVFEELPLESRVVRDLIGAEMERIRVDNEDSFRRLKEFAETFTPDIAPMIEHYSANRPIFDVYGIDDELQRALERRVPLKSGGSLIFDQTEAMTTIDVNTGAYVGHRNMEETIFRTNLEAAQAIARQLRLRNLGGIIIIDFIDMSNGEHRNQVVQALEKSLEADHARTQISEVSVLGLVEMTRKRTRESLEHILCEPCPTCGGRASVKTPETACYEIFREILRESRQYDAQQLLV